MSEIKFRAWIQEWEEYSYPYEDAENDKPDSFWEFDKHKGEIVIYLRNDHKSDPCDNDYDVAVDPIIEQFTGLLDKNGKEIYEGDRVSYRPKQNGKIQYNPDRAQFEVLWKFGDVDALDHHWTTRELEVSGNIHDNPELLEVQG